MFEWTVVYGWVIGERNGWWMDGWTGGWLVGSVDGEWGMDNGWMDG